MNATLLLSGKLLMLLMVANGLPILVRQVLKRQWNSPIDGRRIFRLDGQRWLGPAKTWRGLAAAILGTGAAATLIGWPWSIGLLVGGGAMAGDLLSSFIKRRLRLKPSSMAGGLDQIPESLFPLLAVADILHLEAALIGRLVAGFIVLELLLSRFLYLAHIREQPY